jgi:hypothetical protein
MAVAVAAAGCLRGEGVEPPGAKAEPVLTAPPPGKVLAGITERGTPFIVVRHSGGEDAGLTAIEAVSPQLRPGAVRALLGWCPSSRTFDDPFSGARFDEFGRYVSGPSPSGLVPFTVEILREQPLLFRLGDLASPIPRVDGGVAPSGPSCGDPSGSRLLLPQIAPGSQTPVELVTSPSAPPVGTRWAVEGTLVVGPGRDAHLCSSYVAGVCADGAIVSGPVPAGPSTLVVEGIWWVVVQPGMLDDPILVPVSPAGSSA